MTIDRLTDKFYWPAFVVTWIGITIVTIIALVGEPARWLAYPTQVGMAALAATAFIVMLCDRKTRSAINAYNFHVWNDRKEIKARRRSLGWMKTLFCIDPDFPDPLLQRTLRIAWVVGVIAIFVKDKDTDIIAFESFFLVGVMLMMRMKRTKWGQI
jgi:hypothetical protein